MQIEKALIKDRLRISNVCWKFCIPTIYNFTVIYSCNLLFSSKIAYFLKVFIAFSVHEQNFTAQWFNNLKSRAAMNTRVSVFVICTERLYFCYYKICMTVPLT